MSSDKLDSKRNSDEMSLTRRQLRPHPRTERSYLTDQAAEAKSAMLHTVQDMKQTLIQVVDVRSCTRRHPWLVTGSAVAVGVVAGIVLTPSTHHSIRKARKTPSDSTAEAPPASREQESPRTKKSYLFSIAGTVLAAVLQPVLQSWFAPAVAAPDESRDEAPSFHDSSGAVESASEGD